MVGFISLHSSIMAVVSLKSSPERSSGARVRNAFCTAIKISRASARRPGDVQQHEQHSGRPHPQEFIEIASHALPALHSRNLSVTQRGSIAMERVGVR